MRRERAGTPLTPGTAQRLIEHAQQATSAVLDGFPAVPEHVDLLPPHTIYCVVWTPRRLREERLALRSASTKRQWTPGLLSARESALPAVIRHIRSTGRCVFVRNVGDIPTAVAALLEKISAA